MTPETTAHAVTSVRWGLGVVCVLKKMSGTLFLLRFTRMRKSLQLGAALDQKNLKSVGPSVVAARVSGLRHCLLQANEGPM